MKVSIAWLHDWSFRGGKVTRAFDEWRLELGYLMAYQQVAIRFQREGYQRLWDRIGSQPSDGEGPELPDLFDEEVGGLTDWQFDQIHLAAVLRDAVTIFDMYLEAALAEVLASQLGRAIALPERSPYWDELRHAWKVLAGINVAGSGVRQVRGRRNWLTHQRGQFRTDDQRRRHDTHEFGWSDEALRLTDTGVTADLVTLGDASAAIDLHAFRLSWGREAAPAGAVEQALSDLVGPGSNDGASHTHDSVKR